MVKVELELERYANGGTPRVLGSVRVGEGDTTAFVGWVALLALLERVVDDNPQAAPSSARE